MTHTVDTLMALAEEYAHKYADCYEVEQDYHGLHSVQEALRAALSAIALAAPQAVPATTPPSWPKERDVGRLGDMSPNAHIRIGFDSDNDVYVSVWDENGGASIEFCQPGAGGGKSSKTRMALIALMVAMEADNADTPALDWWAPRTVRSANGGGMTHTVDTTGHCKEKAKPGGCQLHNVQCGYPKCDRQ